MIKGESMIENCNGAKGGKREGFLVVILRLVAEEGGVEDTVEEGRRIGTRTQTHYSAAEGEIK